MFCLLVLISPTAGCKKEKDGSDESLKTKIAAYPNGISPQVEKVLQRKIGLIETLGKNPVVLKFVKASNLKNQDITLDEILILDEKWKQSNGINGFIKALMTNSCAQVLIEFQDSYEGFPEIFVTDIRGLIVCETNKTTDYYQADEAWWTETYNQGRGKSHFGGFEYDESAFAEAISIYIPVIDPDTGKIIGTIKAVCDITQIKMEL